MAHKDHVPHWKAAMRCGLMGGRPFSEPCVQTYQLYIDWFLGKYQDLTVDNVKDVLLTVPVEHFAKRLKIYEATRCFARYLIEQEELDPLFLEKVRRFKPRRHIPAKKTTVDEASIERLLQFCDTPLDTILVELLSQTGLRVTEACQLKLEDLELEKGYLTVKRAKWGKTRRVGLTLRARQALEVYLTKRPACGPQQLLITGGGKPVVRYGVRTRLEKLGRRADVKVTPHALRRAFVTINANKGRPLPMLQIACGHSDITTTRSYCMTTEDEAIEAMQGWN
jgi:integrase